jgi:signal transduction histidine kinase
VVLDATSRYGLIRLIMMYMAALWLTVLILYVVIMGRFSKNLILPFVENDEKQKRFITNASHELKTPLAVISANTEMTEVLGGKSKWTESTRRQIKRLQALIEDLVVLTRLDEMKEADLSDVDLSAVVSETAEPFRSIAESEGKSFSTQIAPDTHIRGDRRGLQQVTSILIDNAVKYCDKGGAIAVTLEGRARGKGARITVANTYAEGKNVDTSRFFERFYRQDESHNSEKSGFGIGLSMAKEIVERMKGRLKIGYADNIISFTVEI